MEKKKGGWIDTCERFVAFLDIMGFIDMVFRKSHAEVKIILDYFYKAIGIIENTPIASNLSFEQYLKVSRNYKSAVRIVIFSDSILLISRDGSKSSFEEMLYKIQFILFIAFSSNIPIKGVIAYGEQTADFNKSLYFGRPLIDAFGLQNELLFYGVVLHHTFESRLGEKGMGDILESELVQHYPVPMKLGKVSHNSINWTFMSKNPLDSVNKLYSSVSGSPRIYVDNTLEFVSEIQTKQEKLRIEAERQGSIKKKKP
jgi:hypothetical protein